MRLNIRLSLIIKSLAFLLILLVLIVGVLDVMDVSFTSDKARRVLLEQIKIFTQRDVRIDGEVQISVSLVPKLQVERIHIKNAEGFGDEDFIAVSEARVEISL